MTGSEHFVTYEKALDEVNSMLASMDGASRGGDTRRVAAGYASPFASSRSADGQSDGLFYIFNFENDEGFAIASGDDRVEPILAVIDEGHLTPGEPVDNPGFALVMDMMEDYYATVTASYYPPVKDGVPTNPITTEYGPWEYYTSYGEQLSTKWGQDWPYNYYHSNKVAGCSATAVAQIMAYHEYPTYYGGYTFNWGDIKKHRITPEQLYTQGPCYCGAPHDIIGRLFDRLGISVNLDIKYGLRESEASPKNTRRTFEHFGYTQFDLPTGAYYCSYDVYKIKESLIKLRPVFIGGTDKVSGGHAWVIDEILEHRRERKCYRGGVLVPALSGYESKYFVHCNFGWDSNTHNVAIAYKDGYYLSGVFDVAAGPVSRSRANKEYYFQYELNIIPGIAK